jgi:MFS family permease
MFCLPETPRYHLMKSRVEKAKETFRRMLGDQATEELVEEQVELVLNSLSETGQQQQLPDVWQPKYRRQLIVGAGLQALQQLCGINTVMYYSGIILQRAGFKSHQSAITFAILIAATNAVFTGVSLITIDRFGRRQLLLATLAGLSVGLFCLGLSFQMSNTSWLALFSLMIYVAFFATGIGTCFVIAM